MLMEMGNDNGTVCHNKVVLISTKCDTVYFKPNSFDLVYGFDSVYLKPNSFYASTMLIRCKHYMCFILSFSISELVYGFKNFSRGSCLEICKRERD
jgi:hypothetical protein